MERREVVYVLRSQNNYDQKCNFSGFGPQKTAYWAASEKNLVILSFTYSVLYCFLFVEEKKPQALLIVQFQATESLEILHEYTWDFD